MILDSLICSNIGIIGNSLCKEANINGKPKNIHEMKIFLEHLKYSINKNDFKGILIANIFFHFVSDIKIRNRNTTARTFEDIFSALFSCNSTDKNIRNNPKTTDDIIKYDSLCKLEDWKISTDLSTNKREKTDLTIGKYNISLKTLKGVAYSKENKIMKFENKQNDFNSELNVGSFSYRALLKGILSDEDLKILGDRKNGLGSGKQLRENIFNPVLKSNKKNEFYTKLKNFLTYVYEDDFYIILKSNYRIDFILIPNNTFVNTILKLYNDEEHNFEKVFYRWENNNLRLNWKNLLNYIKKFKFEYYRININLDKIDSNLKFNDMKKKINHYLYNYLKENI